MTLTTRAPAVAGQFYPADPVVLARGVDGLLAAAAGLADAELARGYLVPHAGYRYSGPTAARVYASLRAHAWAVRRIILIGPAHFVPLQGCAVSAATQWITPLGAVDLDVCGRDALVESGLAAIDDAAHAPEHSLEVQLPFLQRALPGRVSILPVAVGPATVPAIAAVIEAAVAAAPAGTVVLCSSDLSHYLDEQTARLRDEATIRAVLTLDPRQIGVRDACGVHAVRGLIAWAARAGLTPRLLDYRTSAQAAGDPARVVGYTSVSLR